jgi:hypothetical protein
VFLAGQRCPRTRVNNGPRQGSTCTSGWVPTEGSAEPSRKGTRRVEVTGSRPMVSVAADGRRLAGPPTRIATRVTRVGRPPEEPRWADRIPQPKLALSLADTATPSTRQHAPAVPYEVVPRGPGKGQPACRLLARDLLKGIESGSPATSVRGDASGSPAQAPSTTSENWPSPSLVCRPARPRLQLP